MIAAAGYLLLKSDAEIDIGGEKHGAEAAHMEDAKKEAPKAPEPAAKQAEPPTQSPAPVPSFQQSATPSSDMEDATKGAKKMDAIKSLKESVVSVGGNKYRIL